MYNLCLGFLRKDRYQVYANYIVKFLDAYKSNGIDVWAVSTGNEPLNAYVPFDRLNTMGWTPDTLADWVANYAGPTLAASTHNGTKILVLDDQRIELPWFVNKVFKDKTAKKYIVGTAVHWYTDSFAPPILLDLTHYGYPDKFILMTEACTGKIFKYHISVTITEQFKTTFAFSNNCYETSLHIKSKSLLFKYTYTYIELFIRKKVSNDLN